MPTTVVQMPLERSIRSSQNAKIVFSTEAVGSALFSGTHVGITNDSMPFVEKPA